MSFWQGKGRVAKDGILLFESPSSTLSTCYFGFGYFLTLLSMFVLVMSDSLFLSF